MHTWAVIGSTSRAVLHADVTRAVLRKCVNRLRVFDQIELYLLILTWSLSLLLLETEITGSICPAINLVLCH